MFEGHPNLSREINGKIAESEVLGGVWVHPHPDYVCEEIKAQPVLPCGAVLKIQTRNTLYTLEKRGEREFYIQGHPKYCPEPTRCYIAGSSWGGSMMKAGFIGRGMVLEFSTDAFASLHTSTIQEITEVMSSSREAA